MKNKGYVKLRCIIWNVEVAYTRIWNNSKPVKPVTSSTTSKLNLILPFLNGHYAWLRHSKPRLKAKLFAFALFGREYSFQLFCLGNSFMQDLQTFQLQNEAWWWNLLVLRKHAWVIKCLFITSSVLIYSLPNFSDSCLKAACNIPYYTTIEYAYCVIFFYNIPCCLKKNI